MTTDDYPLECGRISNACLERAHPHCVWPGCDCDCHLGTDHCANCQHPLQHHLAQGGCLVAGVSGAVCPCLEYAKEPIL